MKAYTTRDVSTLIGLTVRQSQEYGRSGILDPDRDHANRYLFSFQDLVLLRTAKGLLDARVPQRRILRALRRLKEQLPLGRSLTEVRIAAEGEDLVVYDEGRAWAPATGQLHFVFDVADLAARVEPLAGRAVEERWSGPAPSIEDLMDMGLELESHAPARAREAYEKVLERAPDHADALVNLGRLLHEDAEPAAAARLYRRAVRATGGDHPTAAFNLGIALEDLGRDREAATAYRDAITADPRFADAHYNLSGVYARLGDRVSALRHLKAYRVLVDGPAHPRR